MSSADPPQLPFGLRRFDALAMLLCAIVGLDTIGSVAARGPEGLTWMAIFGVLFFAPYGLLIAELGSTFPEEEARTSGRSWPSAASRRASTKSLTGSAIRSGWAAPCA
jgi:hypothetical protein